MVNLSQKTGVIILGGHVQALGIMRTFGEMNLPCILIDDTSVNISRFSRYCNRFERIDFQHWLSRLKHWKENNQYRNWMIFPTNDAHVELLSKHREELSEHFFVTTDEWNIVSQFYDKTLSYSLCRELGIPIAATFTNVELNDLQHIDISFPCIIKPAIMHSFYSKTKKKVLYCHDRAELEVKFHEALEIIPQSEIIIQEIIQGDSNRQFSACFFSIKGEVMVQLSACRMRQHPIDFGNATTYAESMLIPEILDFGKRILSHTHYTGLCEIEFKKDIRDNQYKFLEVNPRTWKWHPLAMKSKSPFLQAFYDFASENKIEKTLDFQSASYQHGLTDFPIQLKLWKLKKNYAFRKISPTQYAVWDRRDPLPWLMEKLILPYLILSR
jgi:predicted ATP-grasp superfamily ATP-dependent carboligase